MLIWVLEVELDKELTGPSEEEFGKQLGGPSAIVVFGGSVSGELCKGFTPFFHKYTGATCRNVWGAHV